MIDLQQTLRDNGYNQYPAPPTKAADVLMQKEIADDVYVNGYVYGPRRSTDRPVVEFESQVERENDNLRVLLFTFEELDSDTIERVESDILEIINFAT